MKADLMGDLNKAAQQAFAEVNSTLGFQTDKHLARYQQMQPEDFQALSRQYGEDAVIDYITAMESRRMKGGRHGTR